MLAVPFALARSGVRRSVRYLRLAAVVDSGEMEREHKRARRSAAVGLSELLGAQGAAAGGKEKPLVRAASGRRQPLGILSLSVGRTIGVKIEEREVQKNTAIGGPSRSLSSSPPPTM
jgi:hypothetical protein